MMIRLFCCFFLFTVSACGNEPATETSQPIETPLPADVVLISWDDLLPEGEEDKLDEMYASFYRDLESQLMSGQIPLSQAGGLIGGIEEGSDLDTMPQLGTFKTVEEFDGVKVRLPGFVVPLDYESQGKLENFLFVPYFGACIHTPPPPPNQIVFIEGSVDITYDDIWQPFWAEGVLHTDKRFSDLGDAAYTLKLDHLLPYSE